MSFYPISLDLEGRNCIVVGGGRVAERKVNGLLACSAQVSVISPELTEDLRQKQSNAMIAWVNREYQTGDLAEAFLVIAATDDEATQQKVYDEATARKLLLNVADVPQRCNFILPATVKRGDLFISISTSGKSPALARKIRMELEKRYGPEYRVLVEILGALRPEILAAGQPQAENEQLFNSLQHDDFAAWIKNREWEKVAEHLRSVLGGQVSGGRLAEILDSIDENHRGEF